MKVHFEKWRKNPRKFVGRYAFIDCLSYDFRQVIGIYKIIAASGTTFVLQQDDSNQIFKEFSIPTNGVITMYESEDFLLY